MPHPFLLSQTNLRQLSKYRPNVAVLPWGATEAHNYHLPYTTDVIEATSVAERAAELAHERGARPIVLPTIPYGNDAQQLDQVATIHLSAPAAIAILGDVTRSLAKQGIDRLVLLNGHGGNDFKPMVRDAQLATGMLIVVVNFWQLAPEKAAEIFDDPGDHGGELETSLIMHLAPDLVQMDQAGPGSRVPFAIEGLGQPGVWTPRPWAQSHPDTGAGDPSQSTADKGRRFFDAITAAAAEVIVGLSKAEKGQLPYL